MIRSPSRFIIIHAIDNIRIRVSDEQYRYGDFSEAMRAIMSLKRGGMLVLFYFLYLERTEVFVIINRIHYENIH